MCSMLCRFVVRRDEDAWGVWDTGINAWRSRGQTEPIALKHAVDLELQYGAYGPRDANAIRAVNPAVAVDVAVWTSGGTLDYWLRERVDPGNGVPQLGWFGRVWNGRTWRWVFERDVRRSKPAP